MCFGPVLFRCRRVRAMLWFGGHFMLVFLQELFDVSWHRYVYSARVVVPLKFDATIEIAGPILRKFILFLYAFD